MRKLKIDYPPSTRKPTRQPRPRKRRQDTTQRPARQPAQQGKTPRCAQHPGVHMVLAGSNAAWNTVRYLCPMCNAMGRPPVEVAIGVVSGYWPQRGYGFIDNGGPRIFFHSSEIVGHFTPYVGMPVTCLVDENERGLIGRQVRRR